MRVSTFTRLPVLLLLLAGLTLTLGPQGLRPTPASATTLAATTICGTVNGYVAATSFTGGYITIAGVVYPIDAGATFVNSGLITSGANVCLEVVFDGAGNILSATVTTGAAPTVSVCGTETSYLPATGFSPGYITINGTTYPIAPGVILTGAGFLGGLNPTVCLQANLNSLGQIYSGTISGGSAGGSFRVCGSLSYYVPASPFADGSITVNGRNFAIAANAYLSNAVTLSIGSNICLSGTLDAALEIVSFTVTPNVNVNVVVCGGVTVYVPASPSSSGAITINGQTYIIAAGTVIAGDNLITIGGVVCLNGTLGVLSELVSGSITLNTPPPSGQTLSVCGVVTDYTAATLGSAGLVSLGGATYSIAAGSSITGASLLVSGTNVCLQATLNSAGQIIRGTATFNGVVTVSVCGTLSAYTAATGLSAGSITIAGITFPIAAGTYFTGPSALALSEPVGITFTLNGQGLISSGAISSTACTGTTVSGPISSYVPPTATTVGSITINGATYPVAAGTVLTINGGPPLSAALYQPRGLHPRYNTPE